MSVTTGSAALVRKPSYILATHGLSILRDFGGDLAVLAGSYLVALYLRHSLPFGKNVGANYEWNNLRAYFIMVCAVTIAYVARIILTHGTGRSGLHGHFLAALGAVPLAVVGLTLFVPRVSGLQKGYFAIAGLAFVALVVPWRHGDDTHDPRAGFASYLRRLWAHRSLLRIWVYYNVRSRYSQAFLGVLWIVLLPLTTALVLSVVFSQVMRLHLNHVPFIAFFLAGFVPWGLFNQSIAAGMRSILSAMGLINQINFPKEIIVLSALGEALVDTFFVFAAMMVINAIVGVYPNAWYAALPLLLLIEIGFTLGLMLMVSWLSVVVRDVPQLVSVVLQILFYLSPIIYPLSLVPQRYQFLITLNPIAVVVEGFHSIIVHHQSPNWFNLVYPATLAVVFLVFGYRLFKSNEDRMADMV